MIRIGAWISMAAFLFLGSPALQAADQEAAFLKIAIGDVVVRSQARPQWQAPREGMPLSETSEIRTGPDAQVVVWLDETGAVGKAVMADAGVFRLSRMRREKGLRKTVIDLGRGTLTVQGNADPKASYLEIKTPTGRVAVNDAAMRLMVE